MGKVYIPPAPETPQKTVVDVVHGQRIEDPFRWLEDSDSPETVEWTSKQNERTGAVLNNLPWKAGIKNELYDLLSREIVGSVKRRGSRLFFLRRRAGMNQPILCVMDETTREERVLLDPNKESDRGLVALDWWYPSPDGNLLAYGYSEKGDEWSVLHVLDVVTGERLRDRIERTRYSSVAWDRDGKGFYYTRYPRPGQVPAGDENYYSRVFYHKLGDDPANDPLIFGEGRRKEDMFSVEYSDDGRYLFVSASSGWTRTDLYFRDASDPEASRTAPFMPVIEGEEALSWGISAGDTLYLMTNFRAPRYRIVKVDLKNPSRDRWEEIVPEQEDMTLTAFGVAQDRLVLVAMKDAVFHLYLGDLHGSNLKEIPLPDLGTVTNVASRTDSPIVYVEFQSFTMAPSVLKLDTRTGRVEVFLESEQAVKPGEIAVRQVFYPSKDGTRVPMFILHRKDIPAGKTAPDREEGASGASAGPGLVPGGHPLPTVLTGYGGFNLARTPVYSATIIPWLRKGGVYAVANLRGGSEYGEEWHRAGMLGNKQNVFDDFTAAAEYLIREGYTSKEKLGIMGGSNGGLLVGAALTQRPDLFKAVVCLVPLLDMVRYHLYHIAKLWISEYGDPDNPEHFRWLYAYSPYHHVKAGVKYPAVYLRTALSDTRVHPMHARKMAAKLQTLSPDTLTLLRVESEAGHGQGKPVGKVVEAEAESWAFLEWILMR